MKIILALTVLSSSVLAAAAAVAVETGTATFVVNTTVPGISVKGRSAFLHAYAVVERSADGLRLERIQASVPVKTIGTGISLRDEHMRRYIFTTSEGKIPDLRFEAADAVCVAQPARRSEFSCQVSGTLEIRGVARPFSMPLKIRADGPAFRVTGESTVKLGDYGIEQPSQFGVKTGNEIQLHLEFNGKEAPAEVASEGRR